MKLSTEHKSILFLLLIIAVVASIITTLALSFRTDPIAEKLQQDEIIKVLFVLNDDSGNALSTDVLVYYPSSRKGAVFDILGNTGSIYKVLNRTDRIDAIYSEMGIELYRKEIERITGLEIPFTIELGLTGLGYLTDELGGMEVLVPSPVDTVSQDGERWLLPGGYVMLDGAKVKTYSKYILEDETYSDQEDRRQKIFVALLKCMHDNRDSIMMKRVFETFSQRFKSNVDEDSFYTLISYISEIDTERLSPIAITGRKENVGGQTLLFPYEDDGRLRFTAVVRQAVNSLLTDGRNSRVYVLDVLNGTNKSGAAARASSLLRDSGYEILRTDNAEGMEDGAVYEHTVIINHIGNAEAAKALGDFISCKYIIDEEVRPESEGFGGTDVDFTLILGEDWDGRRYVMGGYTGEEEDTGNEGTL